MSDFSLPFIVSCSVHRFLLQIRKMVKATQGYIAGNGAMGVSRRTKGGRACALRDVAFRASPSLPLLASEPSTSFERLPDDGTGHFSFFTARAASGGEGDASEDGAAAADDGTGPKLREMTAVRADTGWHSPQKKPRERIQIFDVARCAFLPGRSSRKS